MWISLPNWSFFADLVGFKLFAEKEIRMALNRVDKLLRNHHFLCRVRIQLSQHFHITSYRPETIFEFYDQKLDQL